MSRYVLVPGWTDDPEGIARLARLTAGLNTVEGVDVLPLHQTGEFKCEQLGFELKLRSTELLTYEGIVQLSQIEA